MGSNCGWKGMKKEIGWWKGFDAAILWGYAFKVRSNMGLLVSANVSFMCCFCVLRLCIWKQSSILAGDPSLLCGVLTLFYQFYCKSCVKHMLGVYLELDLFACITCMFSLGHVLDRLTSYTLNIPHLTRHIFHLPYFNPFNNLGKPL